MSVSLKSIGSNNPKLGKTSQTAETKSTQIGALAGLSFKKKTVEWAEVERSAFTKASVEGNINECRKLWNKVAKHTSDDLLIYIKAFRRAASKVVEKEAGAFMNEAQKLILNEIALKSNKVTSREVNKLLKSQLKRKDVKALQETFAHLDLKSAQVNRTTFALMLKGYMQTGLVKEARELLTLMAKHKIEADVEAYNLVLEAHIQKGDSKTAYALFEEMGRCKIEPNAKTYEMLLGMEAAKGNHKECDVLWKKIPKHSGEHLKLYMKSYRYAARNEKGEDNKAALGLLERGKKILFEALNAKAAVLPSHMNKLMKEYLKVRHSRGIQETFMEMERGKLKPNQKSYRYFIESHFLEKEGRRAEDAFLKMQKEKIPLNAEVFNLMIRGNLEMYDLPRAQMYLRDMKKEHIRPISDTYEPFIEVYSQRRDIDMVERTYKELRDEGLVPTPSTYLAMIKAHRTDKNLDRAEVLYERMQKDGHDLLVATNILVDAIVSAGDWRRAHALYTTSGLKCGTNSEGYYDLHGYSHEVAYMITYDKLDEAERKGEAVGIITGKGNHGKHMPFALRDHIINNIEKDFKGAFEVVIDKINPGRLVCNPLPRKK